MNANGRPLSGIEVTGNDGVTGIPSGTTDSSGSYRMVVDPGTYTVDFYDPHPSGPGYDTTWYTTGGGSRQQSDASLVTVAAASVSNINVTMTRANGPWIGGVLTDPTGQPAANVTVDAYENNGTWLVYGATTDDWGEYWIPLPYGDWYGTYQLKVSGHGVYADGWYGSLGMVYDVGEAGSIEVLGSTVAGVSFTVPFGYVISGRVSSSGGSGIGGVQVSAFADGGYVNLGTTAADGTYSIDVPPGRYNVGFYQPGNTYASGWYGPTGFTSDPDEAVTLTVGPSKSAIDVVMPAARFISGTVRNSAGTVLPGVEVEAYINGSYYGYGLTNYAGQYSVTVGPGVYTVWFFDEYVEYAPGWYGSGGYRFSRDGRPAAHGEWLEFWTVSMSSCRWRASSAAR